MPPSCSSLKSEFERLKAMKDRFALAYQHLKETGGDIESLMEQKIELELATTSFKEKLEISKEKAKAWGFSEVKIEAHEKAQEVMSAIYNRQAPFVERDPSGTLSVNEQALKDFWSQHCSDLPNIPEHSIWFFQSLAEHRLSLTIEDDTKETVTHPSIPYLPSFNTKEQLFVMDYPEFDYNNETEKQQAITPETKHILQSLFRTNDPTNLSREDINTALWSDHDKRIPSDKAFAIIQSIVGRTRSHLYELRLLRYDEYARIAKSQGYGNKRLWTHFEGYRGYDDGLRWGLLGGDRDYGGAAGTGNDHRDYRCGDLSARLVLSRKQ